MHLKHNPTQNYSKTGKILAWVLGLLVISFVSSFWGGCGNVTNPVNPEVRTPSASQAIDPTAALPPPTATPAPTIDPNLPFLANPSFHSLNTPFDKDLGPDGFNWSQAFPIQVDKYNKIFTTAQQNTTGDLKFIYSNDAGLNWSENAVAESYLIRGTIAYDSRNDIIHVLWTAVNSKDGIIYRRYVISRDGSHNIVAITRDKDVNLQLDFETNGKMEYPHPVLLWLDDKVFGKNGALVAVWSARNNAAPVSNEIRISQRILSNTADDGLLGNWLAPFGSTASQVGSTPTPTIAKTTATPPATPPANPAQVAYSLVFSNPSGNIPYASALYKTSGKHARDLYFFYANGNETWEWRRAGFNVANADWSGELTSPVIISKISRAGSDNGYNLKQQLGTKPVEDTVKDRVYFGFATWKDNTEGDTWSHIFVDANDKLSDIADVYSAGKAHSYAPAGDITFDQTSGRLVTAYLKTDKGGTFLRIYNGISPTGNEVLVYNKEEADIPLLWQGSRYLVNDQPKLLILFRGTTRPYQGYFGTLDWLNPAG